MHSDDENIDGMTEAANRKERREEAKRLRLLKKHKNRNKDKEYRN